MPSMILVVFTLGLGLRLYDLTDQPIDFHSTRQLRGAIIARGMYYEMLPTANENTRQQAISFWRSTGQYEPSILERLAALTYILAGGEYIWIARIINALFWMVGGVALYTLAKRMALATFSQTSLEQNRVARVASGSAWLALAYYLLLPFSVQASRSFQPDPGMVMWLLLFACSIYSWSERKSWKWALLSGLFGGMAILTKAIAAYTVAGIGLAMALHLAGLRWRRLPAVLRNPQLWSMAILIVLPTGLYYFSFGGERASEYFETWTLALSHLLLQPWFYVRWAFLVQNLITPVAVVLGLTGIYLARSRNLALLIGAWAGYLVYGLSLPYQMYSHNYYHLQVVALAALSMVPVLSWLLLRAAAWKPVWRLILAGGILLSLAYFTWAATIPMRSQDFRGEPAYWQEVAARLPTDGKIIALTQDYGYRLMYYGWRKVILWPNRGELNLNALRGSEKEFEGFFMRQTADKSYFLITAFRQFEDQPELKQHLYYHFPILAQGNGYLIFSLKNQ